MKTVLTALLLTAAALAQTDPGPRGPQPGPPQSGQPARGLSGADLQAFNTGRAAFGEINDVKDGLGPRFNLDSCAGCHSQPAPGGSAPRINPQLAVAAKFGAVNQAPPFIQPNGPVRVVRFKRDANGSPDGGVHDLFVIAGRSDAPSACNISQPDFSNQNNLSFRIPTPAFGLGLIEAIPDAALKASLAATTRQKQALGIRGRFNTSAADGTITRFGWKAQNKSLEQFTGEAYNVEMGVTSNLFPNEREDDPACAVNVLPEDTTDVESVATFMRLLAPPAPSPANASTTNGQALFASVGCALCHTPSLAGAKGPGEPLLRPGDSPHGPGPGRRHRTRPGAGAGLADRPALGPWGQALPPARRPHERPSRGHPAPRQPRLGGAPGVARLSGVNQRAKAGHSQLPALAIAGAASEVYGNAGLGKRARWYTLGAVRVMELITLRGCLLARPTDCSCHFRARLIRFGLCAAPVRVQPVRGGRRRVVTRTLHYLL
jgi:mono/diheme cytochrome c family protein